MCNSLTTVAAALAIVSFVSLVPDHAQAGSSTSAPSKRGYSTSAGYQYQGRDGRPAAHPAITEFSSSSAKVSVPKR
jgi:hypothetical protein